MSAPPLKMNHADVQTAICRTFKKNLLKLHFSNSMSFSAVDNDGNCSLFLQRNFDGVGKYEVCGQVKMWNADKTISANYNVQATVRVATNASEPEITFDEPITAKRL